MNQKFTRRRFLKTTSLAGLGLTTSSFSLNKYTPNLSFSTLGCPDWSLETILEYAVNNGYKGIELRGIQRELELTKSNYFNSKENILASRKLIEQKNIKVVDLGASAELHHADKTKRKENLEEAKSFIKLAQQLNCPFIRVFPNSFPQEQEYNQTIELIAKGLIELGDYAKGTGVTVLMETHGDVVKIADIEKIMKMAHHPKVGIVWDIVNMWSVTKEPPLQAYKKLKQYIHHTHIKDMKLSGDKEEYVLMGKGNTPIFDAIDILARNKYKGYYSFEWEKYWYPQIEDPEIVIPDYAKVMKQHFEKR